MGLARHGYDSVFDKVDFRVQPAIGTLLLVLHDQQNGDGQHDGDDDAEDWAERMCERAGSCGQTGVCAAYCGRDCGQEHVFPFATLSLACPCMLVYMSFSALYSRMRIKNVSFLRGVKGDVVMAESPEVRGFEVRHADVYWRGIV